jgi:F420-non-reducing hydrogenase large subunit
MSSRVTIDPITRLEGHGKIEIFLDANGDVTNAYFLVPELRGFESFCVGRQAEEMPNITNRICGICPEAHHMAAVKTLDALWGAPCLPAAARIRQLIYSAFFVADHATHFYCLGGPDLIVGPDAPKEERNLLGVIRKVGQDAGKAIIACRSRNHQLIRKLGGRGVHLCAGLPGGWSMPMTPALAEEARQAAGENRLFALQTLELFQQLIQSGPCQELFANATTDQPTHYLGTVDETGAPNYYDGTIRVVDTDGHIITSFAPEGYTDHLAEHAEPWTYMKFPYLKRFGWQGFVPGADSGIYQATPLARLNVADQMGTPDAQAAFQEMYESYGCWQRGPKGRNRPIHQRMATHWARLIELLAAAEQMVELSRHPDLCDPHVRQAVTPRAGAAVGSVEAPRGTLIHHYTCDDAGIITRVNLIVGTTHNNAAIGISIAEAARGLIRKGKVSDGILNRIEMAFRLYDPCCSCATHAISKAPLEILLRSAADGTMLDRLVRS